MAMGPESGSFSRCVRHPSQIFTGFCSFCLAERLSGVDSAERSPRSSCGAQNEIVEVSVASPDLGRPNGGRARKTLLSLFELDDQSAAEKKEHMIEGTSIGSHVTHNSCFDRRVGKSGSCNGRVASNLNHMEDESPKHRGASFRLSSILSKKGSLRRRTKNPSKDQMLDELESKIVNPRRSCDWSLYRDSGKSSLEIPRHSWEGSKAFSCSFACLDEPPQDSSSRLGRMLPESEEATSNNHHDFCVDRSVGNAEASSHEKASASSHEKASSSSVDYREGAHREKSVSRKKSHKWSKVWDWSITSPFRDFVRKRDRVLERSLSESWKGRRKSKNTDTMERDTGDSREFFYGNNDEHGSVMTSQCLNRIVNTVNSDPDNSRYGWQKKERKLGRSRSVHYTSPGNLENGLLRFYLTPLRSSRRSTNRTTRTSRLFTRGILGL